VWTCQKKKKKKKNSTLNRILDNIIFEGYKGTSLDYLLSFTADQYPRLLKYKFSQENIFTLFYFIFVFNQKKKKKTHIVNPSPGDQPPTHTAGPVSHFTKQKLQNPVRVVESFQVRIRQYKTSKP
jgi:hypothetical protein